MQTFYRLRAASPDSSKAEVLREAQRELLSGALKAPLTTASDRLLVHEAPPPAPGQPAFTPNPNAPYAHPFYWAPFVLIGNFK